MNRQTGLHKSKGLRDNRLAENEGASIYRDWPIPGLGLVIRRTAVNRTIRFGSRIGGPAQAAAIAAVCFARSRTSHGRREGPEEVLLSSAEQAGREPARNADERLPQKRTRVYYADAAGRSSLSGTG